jgi:hypothetical protein
MENRIGSFHLGDWFFKEFEYPISKEIRRIYKQKRFFEVIYSYERKAFKFNSTEYPFEPFYYGSKVVSLLIIELEKNNDEPSDFIKHKLYEYFSDKKISKHWFKLNIRDVININNLLWAIEGEYIWDNIKENREIFKTL